MKNLRIGVKISLGFACLFALLLAIAISSISFTARTSGNIKKVELYGGLQNNANELMHILNETRITAGVFYAVHTPGSFSDLSKQLMYCDFRLKKLHEYMNANSADFSDYRADIAEFERLYVSWRDGLNASASTYDLESEFTPEENERFIAFAAEMRKINLLAHEILSNTIADIDEISEKNTTVTREYGTISLIIVISISAAALFAAIAIVVMLVRSITLPLGQVRDVLTQIGKQGDLKISEELQSTLETAASGMDETAQCTSALLALVNRLREIDASLSYVAAGNLTSAPTLQSERDTIGIAVVTMLDNLNEKFRTITESTNHVNDRAKELTEDSQLLASGSHEQTESIAHLSDSVTSVSQKTEKNTDLARKAAELTDNIRVNARVGTDKMNQMMQATADINSSSQSVVKVIKVIDDIAFQTNILALNAAVEAARAGQHGKGFAVVADEVRNLATKSAEAARETSALIEDTIQKAALGASMAEQTSLSLKEIVSGVEDSSSIMTDISVLSQEQSTDISQIVTDVGLVGQIVEQNSAIASRTAGAAANISSQSDILHDLISRFKLA